MTKLFVGSEGTLGVITEVTLRLLPPQHAAEHRGRDVRLGASRAADAVAAITGKIRPSMLEFMDAVAINAVEDKLRMGLDRERRGDDGGRHRRPRHPGRRGCRVHGRGVHRTRCHRSVFDRPTRTRARPSSRRAGSRSPRSRRKGTLLLEDVGVPLPALADLVAGVAKIAASQT